MEENKKNTEEKEVEIKETPKKKFSLLKKILIIIAIIICILFIYMRFLIHKVILINEIDIIEPSLPSNFNGFKITQFSDIHFGRTTNEPEVQKVVENINKTNPDIVVFTGDLFDNAITLSDKNIDFLKNTLSQIKAKFKKYAIIGDSDYLDLEKYKEIMTACDFKILDSENDLIFYNGNTPLLIAGISSLQKNEPDLEKTWKNDFPNVAYKILIAHEPRIINNLNGYNPNLIIAGHTLGNLINIPGVEKIFEKPYTDGYKKGYYETNGIKMVVSSGIGTENFNYRAINTPSIELYRFYNY